MSLLTLYARQEETTDPVSVAYGRTDEKDVVLYKDAQCKKQAARYSWFLSNKPRHGQQTVMHNCFRYRLQWV